MHFVYIIDYLVYEDAGAWTTGLSINSRDAISLLFLARLLLLVFVLICWARLIARHLTNVTTNYSQISKLIFAQLSLYVLLAASILFLPS